MSLYLVTFTIAEEIVVEADSNDAAVFAVKEALADGTYPLNSRGAFVHAKALDEIKRLS